MTSISTRDKAKANTANVTNTAKDFSSAYQQSELRVNQQLFEALIFEGVIPIKQQENNEIVLTISEHISYRCQGVTSGSFERIRLQTGSLLRFDQEQGLAPSLQQLMTDLAAVVEAEPQKWQQFHCLLRRRLWPMAGLPRLYKHHRP